MKKFLSLVLALVMTMSLVTVSAGAKDFTDDSKIEYDEAVAVISALKVVDGYSDGSFNPQGELTRGAAAKIICNLILGPTTAAELPTKTVTYKDVPTNHTFAGYIAYCQEQGIISGYADGTFRPAAPLTGYAFLKMLLGALGYDQEIEGYVGNNWAVSVAKQAIGIGLNAGMKTSFVGNKPVTREEAALYAFNTLKATMVSYDTKTSVNINGAEVTVSNSNAKPVEWMEGINNDGQIKKDGFVQFAEQYFDKLIVKDGHDAFMRPTNDWSIKNEAIGSFVDYTQYVDGKTTAMTGDELYQIAGKTAYDKYSFSSYIDGVAADLHKDIEKDSKKDVKGSGNGALLEDFVDNDDKTVVITVVNTYLAQATADYNSKKNTASFKIFKDGTFKTDTVSGDDFNVADIKADEFVLVTATYVNGKPAIQSVDPVEIIADTEITKFTSGKTGSVTVGGETYNYNTVASYDPEVLDNYTGIKSNGVNLKDLTYNLYLMELGGVKYIVGVDLVATPNNYVFITGIDGQKSNISKTIYTANGIFIDGTMKQIDVKAAKNAPALKENSIDNSWYSYVLGTDNVYTLTKVPVASVPTDVNTTGVAQYHETANVGAAGIDLTAEDRTVSTNEYKIDAKHIDLAGHGVSGAYSKVYGNDATVYLTAGLQKLASDAQGNADRTIISSVEDVTVGVKNADMTVWDQNTIKDQLGNKNGTADDNADAASNGVYTLYKKNGYVIASVVVGESNAVSSKLAYVISSDIASESYDKETKVWTWERDVVINGEKVTLVEKNSEGVSALKSALMTKGAWVNVKYDADGLVKDVEAYATVPTVAAAVTALKTDKTVVLDDNAPKGTRYDMIGNTLYDVTNNQAGFLVADDVKIVLMEIVNHADTTTYETGIKNLEAMLKTLNEDKLGNTEYTLDAVIENGIATVVIINDTQDDAINGPDGYSKDYQVNIDSTNNITVMVAPGAKSDMRTLMSVVSGFLKTQGYTEIDFVSAGVVKAYDPALKTWIPFNFNGGVAAQPYTVNGKYYLSDPTVTGQVIDENGKNVAVGASYLWDKTANTYVAVGTALTAGHSYETGFYKVDKAAVAMAGTYSSDFDAVALTADKFVKNNANATLTFAVGSTALPAGKNVKVIYDMNNNGAVDANEPVVAYVRENTAAATEFSFNVTVTGDLAAGDVQLLAEHA